MHALYTAAGACYIAGDEFIRPRCRRRAALLNALIAHWRLDEASGTRVDAHGGNDLGEINNVGQAAGKIGNAASFVGGNSEALGILDNAALSMGDFDFTLAGWVRFDTLDGAGLVGKWATGTLEYLVHFDGTNLRLNVSSDGSSSVSIAN